MAHQACCTTSSLSQVVRARLLRSNAVRKELTEVVAEFNKRFRTGQAVQGGKGGRNQGGKEAICCFSIQLLRTSMAMQHPSTKSQHSSGVMDSCQCTLTLLNPCMSAPPLLLPCSCACPR